MGIGCPYILENARHCGASLIEYTRRTWSSYMHLTVIRMCWTEPQATENHKICTRVHRNCVRPGYNIQACRTQAWSSTGYRSWRWHGQM